MTGGNASRRDVSGSARAGRRIEAARGYLALEMAAHALQELAAVRGAGYAFDVARLRGEALFLLGRFHEASVAYARALAERPAALPARMAAAACHHRLGRLDRAVAAMEEANRLHPNEPAVLSTLARFCVTAGETDRALDWLGQAVRICPEVAEWAERHDDFASVAAHPRFRSILVENRCRKV